MNWLNGLIGQLNTNHPNLGQAGYNAGSGAASIASSVASQAGNVAKGIFVGLSAITGVLGVGANILKTVFQTASSLMLTGLKVLLGAIAGVIGGFTVLVKQTMDLAKSITGIRNATGLSMGQSANLSFGAGALGISKQDLASITNNPANLPALFNQRSGALGVGGGLESAGFFSRLASQYQDQASQGAFGRQIANQRLNALFGGSAPDSVRAVANMNPSQIRAQEGFASKAASAVGLDPDKLRQYAEDLPLLTARASTMFDLLKTKLALEVLPAVLQLADGFSTFLSGNIGGIVSTLKTVGSWLITTLPQILINIAKIANTAFMFVAQGAVNLLKALELSGSGVNGWIDIFLRGTDIFFNTMINVVDVLSNIGVVFGNMSAFIYNTIMTMFQGIYKLLGPITHRVVEAATNMSGDQINNALSDRMDYRTQTPFRITSNLAGYYKNTLQPGIAGANLSGGAQDKLDSWKTGSSNLLSSMQGGLDSFKAGQDLANNKSDKQIALLQDIKDNGKKNNGGALGSTVARLASYQIIDTYEMAFR